MWRHKLLSYMHSASKRSKQPTTEEPTMHNITVRYNTFIDRHPTIDKRIRQLASRLGATGALDTGTWLPTGQSSYEDSPDEVIRSIFTR